MKPSLVEASVLPPPLRQTGLLVMGPANSKEYLKFKDTLEKNNIPVVHLHKGNFSKHIPNVNLAEGSAALVDITAGVLFADRALKTAQVRRLLLLTSNRRQDRLSCLLISKSH